VTGVQLADDVPLSPLGSSAPPVVALPVAGRGLRRAGRAALAER
jgi:hypothetical protein